MSDPAAADPKVAGVLKRPFPEQVAFFRAKLGKMMPSAKWDDVWKGRHDQGFMVAGAAKADLLSDLAAAVDRVIAEGGSIQSFRKDFARIVERNGWDYRGEFNWRTRVIYTTNLSTSYAAGRLAQLREGGFEWWVYKHSDSSLHPRPLHVSWNGLTLRADDPWWKAHYPPNGWGCRCRVVGVRRPEDADRYGGEVRTAPDNGIDPKTGEPSGIDRGWGYMPGDTVSDAVRTMAAKTQQWDYSLAKSYMQGVPESVRDRLATSYRSLPSVEDDVRRYADRASKVAEVEVQPYRTMGLLTSGDVSKVKELTGVDVAGFDYALDKSSVRHILGGHGNEAAEVARGQLPVSPSDFSRLPRLLNAPDKMEAAGASRSTGHPLVKVSGEIDGEEMEAVFELRGKRRMAALITFYKRGR